VTDQAELPDPDSVLSAFGLGGPAWQWTPVSGAWSNRVFRLDVAGQAFAVKQMRNPWGLPRWEEWLAEAWSFELLAITAGVAAPAPVANPATGGCLARVRSERDPAIFVPVRVHRWVTGRACPAEPVDRATAQWAGQLLATVHQLAVRPRDRSLFPVLNTDIAALWPDLTADARQGGADWAPLMAAAAPSVLRIAELAGAAGHLPGEEVMSHGDIDQKNLLLTATGPVLCDWDVAMPVVPRRELADVAMSLACWQDNDVAREVVRAYRASGGDDTEITADDLGPSMMAGLDWIAFNVERALDERPAGPAEVNLAQNLLTGLLAALPGQLDAALRITDILRI
jgi:aminoglycoside phosphotransferase (APT) family kinase protein